MRLVLLAILVGFPASGQWLKHPTPGIPRTPDGKPDLTAPAPKTADGKPDLSGMWRIQPAPEAANIAKSLKPDEIKPWAVEAHKTRLENLGSDSFAVACLPAGPVMFLAGEPKIIQTPSVIVFLFEDFTFRQIHLDGRELPVNPTPAWMGYSVGRWEGETLVVTSAGFNDRSWLDFEGHPHSEALRVTERFRRRDFGHMDLEVTLEDPEIYAKPVVIQSKMEVVTDTEMLEYVCAENEKSRVHLVGKASDDKTIQLAPGILSKYAGEYELPDFVNPEKKILIKVFLKESELNLEAEFGSAPLRALSETEFLWQGAGVRFSTNKDGVMEMTFRIVEGDFTALRK